MSFGRQSATQGDKLQKIGETVFIFIDTIQALYAEGEPTVRQFLEPVQNLLYVLKSKNRLK